MIGRSENSLGALLHEVSRQLSKLIDRKVEDHNLTRAKWLALGVLDRKEGLSLSALADEIEVGNASAGKLVDRLEARGFVTRKPDPADKRMARIFIKDSARPKLDELEQVSSDIREQALQGISEEDQAKLIELLAKIKMNVQGAQHAIFCGAMLFV